MKTYFFIFCLFVGALFGSHYASAMDWSNFGKSILNRALDNRSAGSSTTPNLKGLASDDVAAAFKQALTIGSENVVAQLGQSGGFLKDPKVRIPLPKSLASVQSGLKAVGMSYLLDDLETRLNGAAEIATPHAKALFFNAISEMSFDDVMGIYNGPQDSATQYFRSKMSPALAARLSPFVDDALAEAGAIKAYDQVMGQYSQVPFMPNVKANLSSYVVDQGINGIFYYLAQQEQAIRQDPVRQTTTLLKTVFGR